MLYRANPEKCSSFKMASNKWACIIAISLLLSLGMCTAQRSLLMSSAKGQEVDELTDFDLPGGIAGTMGSSNEGSTTASSDMGSFGQDMLSKVRPDHRDLSMADGWDMDPHDEDCGDQACDAHDNPGVFNEPEPTTRFPGDPYNPPLGQWQGQLLYCTPMSCQGRKEGYVPGDSGDCMGFSMLIEYPPPPPLGQQGVRKSPLYSPSGANPDGHKVPSSKTVAFPPESSGTKTSDNSGGTWEEQIMPGH